MKDGKDVLHMAHRPIDSLTNLIRIVQATSVGFSASTFFLAVENFWEAQKHAGINNLMESFKTGNVESMAAWTALGLSVFALTTAFDLATRPRSSR